MCVPHGASRNHSEPAFKVTELPFGDEPRDTYEAMPGLANSRVSPVGKPHAADSAKALAAGKMTLGRQESAA